MKIVYFVLCLAVVGCATRPPKVWTKESVTQDQMARDKITCRQYGMQSAQTNGLANNAFVEMWIKDKADECMSELGYY